MNVKVFFVNNTMVIKYVFVRTNTNIISLEHLCKPSYILSI